MKKFILMKLVSLMLIGTAWGQVDKLQEFAHAIARTEGFYAKRSLPNRLRNPGDIRSRLRHAYSGQIGLYHGYVVFRRNQDGWNALYTQLQKVIDATSRFYTQDMTMAQIAKVYATSPQWPRTLCKILKITPAMTFEQYFNLPPRIRVTGGRYEFPVWPSGPTPMPVLQSMQELYASLY